MLGLAGLLAAGGLALAGGASEPEEDELAASARKAIEKGLAYLVRAQNADGSWGTHGFPGPYDEFWWNIETHRAWRRATTALCCLALLEEGTKPEEKAAVEKGTRFLVAEKPVKRPSDWDTDNTWGYVYALHYLARAAADPFFQGKPEREAIRKAAEAEVANLLRYQTPDGGWGYYDFETMTKRPSWATSFMTAAAVIGLLEARESGIDFPPKMLERALYAVRRCRLPSGAYTYSVVAIPSPGGMEWIDQVKGSLGRIQVCNLALELAGPPVPKAEIARGLENFFAHHRFLEVARKRPIPHEAYYFNSGYFFYFGHFYAALLIERLPPEEQARFWPKLQRVLAERQEQDGSWWDYYMNGYHRPYGTAYSVIALGRSLSKASAGKSP